MFLHRFIDFQVWKVSFMLTENLYLTTYLLFLEQENYFGSHFKYLKGLNIVWNNMSDYIYIFYSSMCVGSQVLPRSCWSKMFELASLKLLCKHEQQCDVENMELSLRLKCNMIQYYCWQISNVDCNFISISHVKGTCQFKIMYQIQPRFSSVYHSNLWSNISSYRYHC